MQDGVTQNMMINGIPQMPWTMEHFVQTVAVTKTGITTIITATQMETTKPIVATVGTNVEVIGAHDVSKTTGTKITAKQE